jgi:hypothetical protein
MPRCTYNEEEKEEEKKPSKADNFFESFKNDPQAILEWCDNEIREYQKLKDLILGSSTNPLNQVTGDMIVSKEYTNIEFPITGKLNNSNLKFKCSIKPKKN